MEGRIENGNMFEDAQYRSDTIWYVPSFTLAGDNEQTFKFSATQTGPDAQGNPINSCQVTFVLKKVIPDDVTTFKSAHPAFQFLDIGGATPPEFVSLQVLASLSTKDGTINEIPVTSNGDGLFLLNTTLMGQEVLSLYDDLKFDGTAKITTTTHAVIPVRPDNPMLMHAAFDFHSDLPLNNLSSG
jgi:hypothetical protein